jgi:LytS/YehU family sensor histidine kinase
MYLIVYGKLPENQLYWILRSSYIAIVVSFAISIFSAAMGFLKSWKESVLETERVKAEMLRYKYESLQNQINPHFLFNSFNVLSDLVYEDQKKAVNFIGQLSQLFRYVLESRDKELVPVAEELAFISAFAFLLQTRFEDKLNIEVVLDSMPDEMMVPMTLQLLIENCVKHNEISASKPLHIRVYREDSMICVVNNRQPKALSEGSTGKGLNNLVQQYGFFTERRISISETGEDFLVKIPVLNTNDQ